MVKTKEQLHLLSCVRHTHIQNLGHTSVTTRQHDDIDCSYVVLELQEPAWLKDSSSEDDTRVVTWLIHQARTDRGELAMSWRHITEACCYSPWSPPRQITEMALDCYNNFSLRVTSGTVTTKWNRLENEIITGCTLPVILLALARNRLAKSTETEYRCPWMNGH